MIAIWYAAVLLILIALPWTISLTKKYSDVFFLVSLYIVVSEVREFN